jgi:hypothetical protein
MTRRLLSFLLLGCVVALAVTVPVTPVSALEMEYFPFAPGSSLIFNSTSDDGEWMTKRYIDEEWEFLGGPYGTFTVLWAEAHMMPEDTEYTWINHMWLSKTADTVLWWGFEDANAKIVCSSSLNYVTEPVEVGAVHRGTTTGTLTLKGDGTVMPSVPFAANYTIEALEDVTTPAGTFEDCIKIHEEEITPDGQISFYVWYAPNVGAVQYYYPQQENRWDVLVEYTVDIENDPWNTWFLPQVPFILTLTTIAAVVIVVVVAVVVIRRRKM